MLRDHLGNTRLTFADKNHDGYIQALDGDWDYSLSPPGPAQPGYTEGLQEDHYYPFGMAMDGPWRVPQGGDNVNRFQYHGKEMDADLGLDWYHYGFRRLGGSRALTRLPTSLRK